MLWYLSTRVRGTFSLSTSKLQIKEEEKNAARTTLETLPLTKDSKKYVLSEMDLRQYESPTYFNQIEKGKFVMKTRKQISEKAS